VSSYIYQAFLDNNLSKFENLANLATENGLSENLQIQNLYEMMNFEGINFDKAIATSFKKKVETEVKYKSECKSVESVLTKIQGSTTKIDKSEYKTQGKTPIISQEKIFISGYTDLEIEAITDLPLIVFGDHTKIFKFINFPFVRGADGVCLLKPNSNYFIPKAFFYIIESLDFEGQQDYTRHYKFLSKTLIPIPDFSVQQKIISEIEEIEQQETSQKERKEVLKSEIESVLIKIESIEKVALKNIALLQKGKTITKSQTTIGKIPVIAGGKEPAYYHNVANENKNVITVSASGANAGFISYHTQEIWASDCITIRSYNETEISTYLIFKFLAMQQKNIYELQRGQAQPHVYVNDLEKMKIPLPPLEIQTQILAKILILETELTKIAKFLDTVKAMKETVLQKYL
jgi:restriction endonuclease S subunit